VLVVSEYFWPDEAGTGRYLGDLVHELGISEPNLRFEVVTSRRLYRTSGGSSLPRTERSGNAVVRRLGSLRSGRDSFLRRLTADMVFSLRAAAIVLRTPCDCLLLVTNPPLAPMVVSLVARLRRLPYVYLIHDLYPDVPVALELWSKGNPAVRLLERAQHGTLRSACAVVVLGRCMREHIVERYATPQQRVHVIPHWPTVDGADVVRDSPRTGPPRPFVILYSGNLGRFQDFDTLLGAAERLRDRDDVVFRIAGDGARRPYIEAEIARLRLSNVELRGFLPDGEFVEQLASTALGVVSLEPQLEGIGVPSKSYNLLGAGIPLVAIMSPHSEIARVVQEAGCGVRIDHGGSERLADEILHLADDGARWRTMSQAALEYVAQQGGLAQAAAAYASVLERCSASDRGRR
jgi:colanic acid biosynthesis glycosyl transferase WcaI